MKMKPNFLYVFASFLVMLLSANSVTAQVLEFEWAKAMGGADIEQSYSVAVDKNGNVYTTGYFQSTVDFDPGSAVSNITSNGGFDVFVSKLDAQGNFVWAKSVGNANDENSYSIAVDTSGNVYVTGAFKGTVDFDPGTGTQNLTATESDIFLLKLSTSGAFVWAKNMGGLGNTGSPTTGVLKSLSIDAGQNIYMTGSFEGTVDFDPSTAVQNLTSAGSYDVYVAKYSALGNFVWVRQIGSTGSDQCNFITVDLNDLYITGSFSGTVDFNPGTTVSSLTASPAGDMFIAKWNTNGDYVWAKNMGGGFVNQSLSIAVNKESTGGNVYTTGYFFGPTDFDPGPGTATLNSAGSIDAFICKLNSLGNFVWVKNMGGTGNDLGTYIVANTNEDVFITGYYQGTADFDPNAGTQNLISNGGSSDAFISVLNASGNYVLAKSVGGAGGDFGSSIATDQYGNIYTTGAFSGTADFDPGTPVYNLTSVGGQDIFVHKLGVPCVNSTTNMNQTSCGSFTFNNHTYDTTGDYEIHFTTGAGCDSLVTLHLTVNDLNLAVSQNNATLTAAATGATYKWINCSNNSIISGATGQSYTATANGSYAVIVTIGTCSDTSVCTTVSGLTGVMELGFNNQIHLYPNPASDKLQILADVPLKDATMRITNVAGQVVKQLHGIKGDKIAVEVSSFADGLYFIELNEMGKMGRLKFVKH